MMSLNPDLPLFTLTRLGLGETAVGGYVPSYDDGASEIARQISDGYHTSTINNVSFVEVPNQYVFDSRLLREMHIERYMLPTGSVVEDALTNRLNRYSRYIYGLSFLLVGLLTVLLLVVILFVRTRRLSIKLREREGELVEARERAEESDRLKSSFLANMSHEIRTPLNAIMGFSSLIQTEDLAPEERSEYCALVVSNSSMLLTLLNDILDISSLECGKIQFYYSPENIVLLCNQAIKTTAYLVQPGVEVRVDAPQSSYMLVTDSHRLSQVLINLLTNAAKFTAQGSITLKIEILEE